MIFDTTREGESERVDESSRKRRDVAQWAVALWATVYEKAMRASGRPGGRIVGVGRDKRP
jgi:hypothetical protein